MSDADAGSEAARSRSAAPRRPGPRGRAWQRMLSGRRLDLLDPSPLDVEIEDIAHGLSRVARWNGQTRGDHVFSVAQHSLLVEALIADAEPSIGLAVLLHDAPEYVIGDLISPFKAALDASYRAMETRLLAAIHLRFGLPRSDAALTRRIKIADRQAAHLEATRLAGFTPGEARLLFGPPPFLSPAFEPLLEPWPAGSAKGAYLERYEQLSRARAEPKA